jgi:transcriptional regulator with XRE-family HTH domain
MDAEGASVIGQRARMIRRRRGLSLDVVAGLAGLSTPYLSMLERGQRGFNRRGLLEDLATALGCSVVDLTGQPYLPPDRVTADALATLPAVSAALHDVTLDDVPDGPTRPVDDLARAASKALADSDDVQFATGSGLGALITELHVQAAAGDAGNRRKALAALVEVCIAARALAGTFGHAELAVTAARRGYDAARRLGRLDLVGLTAMGRTMTLGRIGARRRAYSVASDILTELSLEPGPTSGNTVIAEACGMLHLSAALVSARDGRTGDASTHLGEARSLAVHTGERNHIRFHFGPANVAAWDLSIAVETDSGPEAAERYVAAPIDLSVFGSRDREVSVHFDLARAWAQAEGARDAEALRALDTADRIAPVRVRNDPIARDLVLTLNRRARRRVWELDSLRHRFGVGRPTSPTVKN